MPIISELSKFFNSRQNQSFESYDGYEDGYQFSSVDILLQRARRDKAVRENKIFDFIQVENDPNFLRSAPVNSNTLNKLVSKLSIATQIVTTVNAKFYMAGITEFLPVNIQQLLFNFQTVSDTGINLTQNIKQLVTFKQIEQAFLDDLSIQFLNGTITYQEIVNIADNILENMPMQESIKNNGLRSLLSLNLQSLFPDSMLGIFDSIQYLDYLDQIFGDNQTEKDDFTRLLSNDIQSYVSNTTVETIVSGNYDDLDVTMDDPLGLSSQAAFIEEIRREYTEHVVDLIINQPNINTEQKEQLIDMVTVDLNQNLESAFRGTIGLPSFATVVKGVNTDSYNKTVSFINSAFDNFAKETIITLGFTAPTNQRPLDYLVNLKKNINARIEMKRRGDTSEAFVEIDKYLKTVISNGDITDKHLEYLQSRLDDILRERNIG